MNPFFAFTLEGLLAGNPLHPSPPSSPKPSLPKLAWTQPVTRTDRMCRDKRCYPDKKAAQSQINRLHERGRVNLRAYPCPNCKSWHLTSQREDE